MTNNKYYLVSSICVLKFFAVISFFLSFFSNESGYYFISFDRKLKRLSGKVLSIVVLGNRCSVASSHITVICKALTRS